MITVDLLRLLPAGIVAVALCLALPDLYEMWKPEEDERHSLVRSLVLLKLSVWLLICEIVYCALFLTCWGPRRVWRIVRSAFRS